MGIADWDQRLFGWAWGGTRKLGRRLGWHGGAEHAELPDHAVRLTNVMPRLQLLAAALSGVGLEVREAEQCAGYRVDAILLPSSVVVGETAAEGVRTYLLAVAYQVMCRRMALRLPATAAGPEAATWLAMPLVLARLERELPGTRQLVEQLRTPLLRSRAGLGSLSGGSLSLELALRAALNAPPVAGASASALDFTVALRAAAESVSSTSPDLRMRAFDAAALALERSLLALGPPSGLAAFLPFGLLRDASPAPTLAASAAVPAAELPSGTEREGRARETVRRIELDENTAADNPLLHSFEKVHTAEEYGGGQKALDGSDELDDQLQALEELDIREVIRTRERAHSILRADALLDGSAPELGDATPDRTPDFQYDEWDGRRRAYRRAHCSLYLERARPVRAAAAGAWVRQTLVKRRGDLHRLEQELARIELERAPEAGQRDGCEIDLDAVVDARATLAAGHTPSDRLYINRRLKNPALSLLVLLDLSLSSDAYVAGERVIDVSREAAFVLGEALDGTVEFAIAGFHSNTRRDCRFVTLKAFAEPWREVRGRLAGLEPRGYTRIGPAVRHGASVLRAHDTRRKALIVVTDGQPTDYDRYEGRHGVQDVAQAVREARRDGVACFAFAVARERTAPLGQMFGHDRYALLQRGSQLPEAMAKLLTDILRK